MNFRRSLPEIRCLLQGLPLGIRCPFVPPPKRLRTPGRRSDPSVLRYNLSLDISPPESESSETERESPMPDNSFDVVSKIEMPEVHNAVQQALKEVHQRFDLKDSNSSIEFQEKENKILLHSKDEFKLKAVVDILQSKLIKRQVPLKGLTYGEITPAAGSTVKQEIAMQQGIPIEKARELVKKIKDSKLKVQASIQGDFVRVASKDRDTLQSAIKLLRDTDFGIDLQFTNYRTN